MMLAGCRDTSIEHGDDGSERTRGGAVSSHVDPDEQDIWVQRGNDYVRLRIADIEWIESERDYVHIHNGERAYLLRATLKGLLARLSGNVYMRVRRSAVVRIDRIAAIRDRGYGQIKVVLRSGAEIRVGRTYVKSIRDRLKQWPSPKQAPASLARRP